MPQQHERTSAVEGACGCWRASRADWACAAGVFALALALRLWAQHQSHAVALFDGLIMDGEAYWAWASALVGGDWVGTEVYYQAPLYPYFLGAVRALLGDSLESVRLVQAALGALACALLVPAGRLLHSRAAGVAAGALLALYPPAIFYDSTIQKTVLVGVATALLLLALAALAARQSALRWLGAGAALGLLMLAREETILLVPVLGAWGLWHGRQDPWRRGAGRLACFGAGLALLLLPVGLRNFAVGGEFLLTTSQAGPNFYIGNNPRADGTYAPLRPGRGSTVYERRDAFEIAQQRLGRALTPGEVDGYWRGQAFEFIRERPLDWLALLAHKLSLVLKAYEVPDAEDLYFYELEVPLLRRLGALLHWGVLLPLAAAGVALTWPRRRQFGALYAAGLTIVLGLVLFYVFGRYRWPLIPLAALLAGAGLAEACRAPTRARWLGALAAALALAAFSNLDPPYARDKALPESYVNSGVVFGTRGEHERAAEMFRRALELKPASPGHWSNYGVALMLLDRPAEALPALRRARELGPFDMATAHMRVGWALLESGQPAEAVEELGRALQLTPGSAEGLSKRARACEQLGRWAQAAADLRQLVTVAPQDAEARARLALLLCAAPDVRTRDGARALALAQALVHERGGQDPRLLDLLGMALAENGRFEEAVGVLDGLIRRAVVEGQAAAAEPLRERRAIYARREAWRMPEPAR